MASHAVAVTIHCENKRVCKITTITTDVTVENLFRKNHACPKENNIITAKTGEFEVELNVPVHSVLTYNKEIKFFCVAKNDNTKSNDEKKKGKQNAFELLMSNSNKREYVKYQPRVTMQVGT